MTTTNFYSTAAEAARYGIKANNTNSVHIIARELVESVGTPDAGLARHAWEGARGQHFASVEVATADATRYLDRYLARH